MDIDLSGLLVFRDVAESGSFSETGRHWNLSQPAVSLLISRLESTVGLVLLERCASGTKLTPAGSHFLEGVNEVCDAYLAFTDRMHALGRKLDRHTLVGVDQSWFSSCLRESFEKTAPSGTRFCEAKERWWEGLESAQYDVVIAGRFLRTGLSPGIQEAVIHQERGITVAWNPDFYPFDPENFNFPEVLRTTILIPNERVVTGFSAFLTMWCNYAYGIQPANTIAFSSEKEAAAAASAGLGVLLGPGDVVPRVADHADGLTHVRTFEFLLPEAFTYGIYCRSGEDSKEILNSAAAIGRAGKVLFKRR